jgi:site-specific DNA-methyltransferase (adenine-specific)
MEIKKIKIEEIKPNPKNPKKHEVELIANSIKEMGYIEPIVIDENNVILAGHGRLKALKELKQEKVEVIIKRGLTKKQKEKYLLLSNKLTEKGGWDDDLLKEFDEDLLSDAGWDSEELDNIFQDEVEEKDDEVPEIPKKPKSKLGDIYQLGRKVFCKNCKKWHYLD